MTDADGSGEVGGEPKAQASVEIPPQPPADQNPPAQPAENDPKPDQTKSAEHEQIKRAEHWLIGIGIATILVNLGLGLIYYQQLTQMRAATEASTRAVDLAQETLQYNASQFDRGMQQTISQTVSQYEAAKEATVAANAAKNAADTAKDALHISESAYITTANPRVEGIHIKIAIVNSGHLASGHTRTTWYEATSLSNPAKTTTGDYRFLVGAWGSDERGSVPPGRDINIGITVPTMNIGNVQNGTMHITVAGVIAYNDGFPKTPDREWPFCYETFFQFTTSWIACNYDKVLPEIKANINYPQNRYD